MGVRDETVERVTGEVRTLRTMVDGLSGKDDLPALVEFGTEGAEIWSYGELAGKVRRLACGLLGAGEDDGRSWRCLLTDEDVDLPPIEPGDGAALFYTSGTTGAAKGVPLSHANLAFQIDSLLGADLVHEEDRVLLPLPLHHVYPFVMGMLTPLAAGLPIILPQSLTGPQLV